MLRKAKAAPKQPAPRARLDSLRSPQPRAIPRQAQKNARKSAAPPQCSNKQCAKSDVGEDDGKLICRTCGFVLQETQITQELTFGEAANGAAVVQGSYVGPNEANARNSTLGNSRVAGGMDSRQVTERNGSHEIRTLVSALQLDPPHVDRAMQVYRLAMNINFIQGRQTKHVAAVCVYVACRRDAESKVMLIDLSDAVQLNVFKLGQTYNMLVKELGLRTDNIGLYDMNPENLIYRFAQDLDFGNDTTRIANEAVQILKRMKRDWMLQGRRPAGVCGAAIILAARMNNYRRTVREVVYTAKVCDLTISKRLEEFRYTDSSRLTVAEFRHHGLNLEKDHDPPAFYNQFLVKNKRRKREHRNAPSDSASDEPSPRSESATPALDASTGEMVWEKAQADTQAMPPPPIPIDPALLQALQEATSEAGTTTGRHSTRVDKITPPKRPRGRPPKVPLPTPTPTQEREEDEMEADIDEILQDPDTIARANALHRTLGESDIISPPLTQAEGAVALPSEGSLAREVSFTPPQTRQTRQARSMSLEVIPAHKIGTVSSELEQATEVGPVSSGVRQVRDIGAVSREVEQAVVESTEPHSPPPAEQVLLTTEAYLARISDSQIIPDDEFAGDPEIDGCLLSPQEIEIRERIWVHENGDYLRLQQARRIKQELAEKNGTGPVKLKRKRRRGRMGDMSDYRQTNEDGQSSGPQTPAEATKAMMSKRGYSKKINYTRIDYLYNTPTSSESGGRTRSGSIATRADTDHGSGRSTPRLMITSPSPSRPISFPRSVSRQASEQADRASEQGAGASHHATRHGMAPVAPLAAGVLAIDSDEDDQDELARTVAEGRLDSDVESFVAGEDHASPINVGNDDTVSDDGTISDGD